MNISSDTVKAAFMFTLVYVALYIISIISPLRPWNFSTDFSMLDYMLWLTPVAGFFFVYMLIPYLREDMGFGDYFIYAFPVLFAIAGYFAFNVAVFYYFDNQAFLSGVDISVFGIDYWQQFINSHFIYFILAGIGGWGARILIENAGGTETPVE